MRRRVVTVEKTQQRERRASSFLETGTSLDRAPLRVTLGELLIAKQIARSAPSDVEHNGGA